MDKQSSDTMKLLLEIEAGIFQLVQKTKLGKRLNLTESVQRTIYRGKKNPLDTSEIDTYIRDSNAVKLMASPFLTDRSRECGHHCFYTENAEGNFYQSTFYLCFFLQGITTSIHVWQIRARVHAPEALNVTGREVILLPNFYFF